MRADIQASGRLLLKITGVLLLALALSGVPLLLTHRAPAAPTVTPSKANTSIDAYRGLATWVSIYERRAWADPEAAVSGMAAHGARTLFIESGNSGWKEPVFEPLRMAEFIRAAHAHGMKIVAWYLPKMSDMAFDYDRIAQAISFKTGDGQGFDSFALDIESTAIHKVSKRNAALAVLSAKIRALVGPSYVLGAIIPSPVGIAKQTGFWNGFPYESVADSYDVIVPMGYYTYHGKGAAAAAADVGGSLTILRQQPGCADVPVHLIGGLAGKTTPAEVSAFARAARANGCIGASLYSWSATSEAEWNALRAVSR